MKRNINLKRFNHQLTVTVRSESILYTYDNQLDVAK